MPSSHVSCLQENIFLYINFLHELPECPEELQQYPVYMMLIFHCNILNIFSFKDVSGKLTGNNVLGVL